MVAPPPQECYPTGPLEFGLWSEWRSGIRYVIVGRITSAIATGHDISQCELLSEITVERAAD